MVNPSYRDIALRYCVDDLPGASVPGARLQKILDCLQLGRSVTPLSLAFLQKQGLEALYRLATGASSYDSFQELALAEQPIRVEAATAIRLNREAEERAREAATQAKLEQAEAARRARREAEERAREAATQAKMKLALEQAEAARRARESDPQYIAKLKQQKLRTRYGIDTYVEPHCFSRLMDILKRVDAGQRLSLEDFVWLSSVAEDYFTKELRAAYHRLEADFFADEFKKTHDPWAAVNASGHYRKCNCAGDADSLLKTIRVEKQKSPKLKSAFCTTHGGVMRDLGCWDEALQLGEKAHAFRPDDYRPCTLLGAVHWEMGNYHLGQEWYAKAVERGATVGDVDQDLRRIFFQADQAKQVEMREFLLREDPVRYAWAKPKARI